MSVQIFQKSLFVSKKILFLNKCEKLRKKLFDETTNMSIKRDKENKWYEIVVKNIYA